MSVVSPTCAAPNSFPYLQIVVANYEGPSVTSCPLTYTYDDCYEDEGSRVLTGPFVLGDPAMTAEVTVNVGADVRSATKFVVVGILAYRYPDMMYVPIEAVFG